MTVDRPRGFEPPGRPFLNLLLFFQNLKMHGQMARPLWNIRPVDSTHTRTGRLNFDLKNKKLAENLPTNTSHPSHLFHTILLNSQFLILYSISILNSRLEYCQLFVYFRNYFNFIFIQIAISSIRRDGNGKGKGKSIIPKLKSWFSFISCRRLWSWFFRWGATLKTRDHSTNTSSTISRKYE